MAISTNPIYDVAKTPFFLSPKIFGSKSISAYDKVGLYTTQDCNGNHKYQPHNNGPNLSYFSIFFTLKMALRVLDIRFLKDHQD
jgi:hypothetical protein